MKVECTIIRDDFDYLITYKFGEASYFRCDKIVNSDKSFLFGSNNFANICQYIELDNAEKERLQITLFEKMKLAIENEITNNLAL